MPDQWTPSAPSSRPAHGVHGAGGVRGAPAFRDIPDTIRPRGMYAARPATRLCNRSANTQDGGDEDSRRGFIPAGSRGRVARYSFPPCELTPRAGCPRARPGQTTVPALPRSPKRSRARAEPAWFENCFDVAMHVDHEVARTIFLDELDALLQVCDGLEDADFVAASRCHGWSVGDVLVHAHLGLQDMLLGDPTTHSREQTLPR